jgi:hypothetical protein
MIKIISYSASGSVLHFVLRTLAGRSQDASS